MLSLRSIWREAHLRRAGDGMPHARSFGTEVPQDDALGMGNGCRVIGVVRCVRSIWREADLRPARAGLDTRKSSASSTEGKC